MALTRKIKNSKKQYGWPSIIMHWLVALAVLGMYPLGLYIVSLGYYDPGYRVFPNIHRSIGLILAALVAVRLTWKLSNTSPQMLGQRKIERFAAHAGHVALYILLFVVFSSGYLISTADGRGISVFGWFTVPAIEALANRQEDFWGNIHFYAATSLMVLTAVHILAALKHHFINKDATLKRMFGVVVTESREHKQQQE
ncbi:cytochrome B [Aliidiomarina iranensis]|uniref:Cytochrome B n=1 Tax=Aliidiomarina iranensis TaxID=1434071 RepID=A0A432VTY5_9GAMM|nr:cytochrome b [Aliidiomarina iranensis]RUO19964.1 cytochrome B [Aliidiomarina iranensis]